jgi:hypothetical protein
MKVAGRIAGISVLALVVGVACMQRPTRAPGTRGGPDAGSGFDRAIAEHARRFATLQNVVDHYNTFMKLGLTTAETRDLIEYLKSL